MTLAEMQSELEKLRGDVGVVESECSMQRRTIERLRGEASWLETERECALDLLRTYRAAVAEVRRLCSRPITDPAAGTLASVLLHELDDKLPRDEP